MKKYKFLIGLLLSVGVKSACAQNICKISIPVFAIEKRGNSCMVILDTAFKIPQLNRTREIRVYLPPSYSNSNKRFPVIYLQDGGRMEDTINKQPIYVLNRMDSLYQLGKSQSIIIAIFSDIIYREQEYNPFEQGQGKSYINFLANTLKPFIDKHFRTLSTRENTIISGYREGAVIALYAALVMPQVFGKAGMFSPEISNLDSLKEIVLNLTPAYNNKLFFYSNSNEKEDDLLRLEELTDLIGQKSAAMVYKMMDNREDGDETAWARWFPEFTLWMNADGYNYVIKPW